MDLPHTNADDESFTKEQIKANSKYDMVDYNCKVYFYEKPEDLVVCRHIGFSAVLYRFIE
ncbi:hypothetical protein DJICPGNB_18760 [Escherichia coli]|nr:hypothetical protein DJICPGNB_18760 [Escherichia coli]